MELKSRQKGGKLCEAINLRKLIRSAMHDHDEV
jgi:uncharacterized protein YwbE